ncbi:MAG: hypothetical protein LBK63_03320 [Treponema sp.]|jgi:hypothetical protein|nr:hypothetical protein [Treponema sp.]
MPSDICPSLFFIVPDTPAVPYNEHDIFKSDRFRILQAESLTRIKELVAHTGAKQTLQIRLLCCYLMKNLPENYCLHRHVEHPRKRVCDKAGAGIKNRFVHFLIKAKKADDNEHFLAFIEGADLNSNIDTLVNEMFSALAWLEITASHVWFNIFTFGEPVFKTRNESYLDNRIDAAKNKLAHNYTPVIKHDTMHISKDFENRLTVSIRNNKLHFKTS